MVLWLEQNYPLVFLLGCLSVATGSSFWRNVPLVGADDKNKCTVAFGPTNQCQLEYKLPFMIVVSRSPFFMALNGK